MWAKALKEELRPSILSVVFLAGVAVFLGVTSPRFYSPQPQLSNSDRFDFQIVSERNSEIGPPTVFIYVRVSKVGYRIDRLLKIWRDFCEKYPDVNRRLDLRVLIASDNSDLSSQRQTSIDENWIAANFLRQGDGLLAGGGVNEVLIYAPELDHPEKVVRTTLRGRDWLEARIPKEHADLFLAAGKGDLAALIAICDQGANVNVTTEYKTSALMEASREGHLPIVKFLVEKHANVNGQNEAGWTALMCAVSHGHVDVARFLIDAGANMNLADSIGMSALTRSIYDRQTAAFKLLLDKGAEISIRDRFGNTPLMIAANMNNVEVIEILLSLDVPVNVKNSRDETPLMTVYDSEATEWLLNHGADANVQDAMGETALMRAVRSNNSKKARVLLAHGADAGIKSKRGQTAVDIANEYDDRREIVAILNQFRTN